MSLKYLIVVLVVMVCRTTSKKIVCQMVSLETDDGMSGYCCVIFRNHSEINMRDAEVRKQIVDSLKSGTREISTKLADNGGGNDGAVNFPTEDNSEIKFPESISSDDLKSAPSDDRNQTVSEDAKNVTESNTDISISNETITVIPVNVNRNAVDIPETCPDGNEKDFNGDCVPVF